MAEVEHVLLLLSRVGLSLHFSTWGKFGFDQHRTIELSVSFRIVQRAKIVIALLHVKASFNLASSPQLMKTLLNVKQETFLERRQCVSALY